MPPPPLSAATSPRLSEDGPVIYDGDLASPIRSPASHVSVWSEGKKPPKSKWRHAVGILLLLATVFLWTASNFLASVRVPASWLPRKGTKSEES